MREVVITDTAKEDIEVISDFLKENFSNNSRLEFLLLISEKLQFIERMPFMYPSSRSNIRVRKCLIHKNSSLFYEVTDNLISILSVIDNRINPDSIKF